MTPSRDSSLAAAASMLAHRAGGHLMGLALARGAERMSLGESCDPGLLPGRFPSWKVPAEQLQQFTLVQAGGLTDLGKGGISGAQQCRGGLPKGPACHVQRGFGGCYDRSQRPQPLELRILLVSPPFHLDRHRTGSPARCSGVHPVGIEPTTRGLKVPCSSG